MKEVAIINYGAGNLGSLINAIENLNFKPIILNKPEKKNYSHIILPGVGNFGKLSKNLFELGFKDYLEGAKINKRFILGICVGMQLLFDRSEESKDKKGIGLLTGEIQKFKFEKDKNFPLPHVGFSKVFHTNSKIWKDIPNKSYFYFIHSFRLKNASNLTSIATSTYGEEFMSFIEKDNIFGAQFHPEKSHKVGLKLINNFLNF
mgnify:FL=1|tara:strand:+ start:270 stop:881 length:612 start_codon:yes stop_codon:yes gene_type:complete